MTGAPDTGPVTDPATDPATEPLRTADGRVWFLPGDIAELTMVSPTTGETETIRGLCIRPRGSYAGWVLADGSRIPLRPRTVIKIDIVYPEGHRATEHLTEHLEPHLEPHPETPEHTTETPPDTPQENP